MTTSSRSTSPLIGLLYPATFGIAYVLLSFAEFPTPASDLIRPILLVLLASLVLAGVLTLVLRSSARAGVATSALLVALSAPYLFVPVMVVGVIWTILQLVRGRWTLDRLRRADAASVSRGTALFGVAFMVIGLVLAAPAVWTSVFIGAGSVDADEGAPPNVYLLLLDGYPRSDTLRTVFGSDNTSFESDLAALGFAVSHGSRTNYAHTWLTVTSMLNGEYVQEISGLVPPPNDAEAQYRALMSALNRASAVGLLQDEGYRVMTVPSPFRSVALQTADAYLDGGQITAFEYSLLMHSQLATPITRLVPDFLMSQQRDRFHSALDAIAAVAVDDDPAPVFLFAHLFSPPHAPLIYGRDGRHLPLPDCVPATCALWEFPEEAWDGLPDQIHYTNTELVKLLTTIVDNDPQATVIVMSDHGSRRDREDLDEFFHNFFAARTPGRESFADDISPVNVVRQLAGLDPLPYRSWIFADEIRPLDLTPFTPAP